MDNEDGIWLKRRGRNFVYAITYKAIKYENNSSNKSVCKDCASSFMK